MISFNRKEIHYFLISLPMFTGIVKAVGSIAALEKKDSILRYAVEFPSPFLKGLEMGASVAVDGVCQTVAGLQQNWVWFDAIAETLACTTFKQMEVGGQVNLERAAKWGDEIGGHLLSGHVFGEAPLVSIEENIYTIECPADWMKYLFTKGFIAIDGISLTLASVNRATRRFSVHLIPETLKRTTLGQKRVGDRVNIEIDANTQAAVETALHFLSAQSES